MNKNGFCKCEACLDDSNHGIQYAWHALRLSVNLRSNPNYIHTSYFSPVHKCKES